MGCGGRARSVAAGMGGGVSQRGLRRPGQATEVAEWEGAGGAEVGRAAGLELPRRGPGDEVAKGRGAGLARRGAGTSD